MGTENEGVEFEDEVVEAELEEAVELKVDPDEEVWAEVPGSVLFGGLFSPRDEGLFGVILSPQATAHSRANNTAWHDRYFFMWM